MPLTSFFRILAKRPLHFLCSLDYAFLIYVKFNVAQFDLVKFLT
jgi:hypothetical protein